MRTRTMTLALLTVLSSSIPPGRAAECPGGQAKPVIRLGAVAYSPDAVTVFEGLRRYLGRHGLPVDYVLYSNYDALVEALHQGQVDVAWNTPAGPRPATTSGPAEPARRW